MKEPFSNITMDDMKLALDFHKSVKKIRQEKIMSEFCRRFGINAGQIVVLFSNPVEYVKDYREQMSNFVRRSKEF